MRDGGRQVYKNDYRNDFPPFFGRRGTIGGWLIVARGMKE
jgi:hypothetical protein